MVQFPSFWDDDVSPLAWVAPTWGAMEPAPIAPLGIALCCDTAERQPLAVGFPCGCEKLEGGCDTEALGSGRILPDPFGTALSAVCGTRKENPLFDGATSFCTGTVDELETENPL